MGATAKRLRDLTDDVERLELEHAEMGLALRAVLKIVKDESQAPDRGKLRAIVAAVGLLGAILAGCGSNGAYMGPPPDAGDPVAAWLGTWSTAAETTTVTCPGQPAASSANPSSESFARGTSSPLVLTTPGCLIMMDENGTTATARPGQSCTDAASGAVLSIGSWTFSIGGVENVTGTVATTDSAGNPVTCSFGVSGSFARVSQ